MTEVIDGPRASSLQVHDNLDKISLGSHHSSSDGTSDDPRSADSSEMRERAPTITKKIPLSEYATLHGILAHQVDEGAPCLKCGPDGCTGLDIHFWKKICKNCGCSRGAHAIQKVVEEKKEIPRSILLSTADEDEEDYKELEMAAPPSKTTIKGKADYSDNKQYNQEYIKRIREFYKNRSSALELSEGEKLSPEQLLVLQQYINHAQGHNTPVPPEVIQSHLHLLSKNTGDYLDVSDTELNRSRTHSSTSLQSDSSDLTLHFMQALQLVQLNKEQVGSESPTTGHDIVQDTSPDVPPYSPLITDEKSLEVDNRADKEPGEHGRRERPVNSTIQAIEGLNNTESAVIDTDYDDEGEVYLRLPSLKEESESDFFTDVPIESRLQAPSTSPTSSEDDGYPRHPAPPRQQRYKLGKTGIRYSDYDTSEYGTSERSLNSYNEYEPSFNISPISSPGSSLGRLEAGRRHELWDNLNTTRSSASSRRSYPKPRKPASRTRSQKSSTSNRSCKNRSVYKEDSYSDEHSSEEDNTTPPPKPLRRNPGSFDSLTQGDIVDYYTTVSPSGPFDGTTRSSSIQRKGSAGVWVPPEIDHSLVKQYLAALPEDKRPVNTLGVQWRIKQLQTQLPRYDHNINYCHEMTREEQEEMSMFVESRKQKAQGQGEVKSLKKKSKKKCEKCGGLVDCAVIADKVPGRVWHPGCFNCTTCEEILVDLIYFQYDGRLYCGRHHAELLRPRCHACDELIFGREFITADQHEYHKEHFCCWECDGGLGGSKYVSHKGQPYCQGCYEKLFCTRCVQCREPIGAGAPLYKHGSLRWHGNSQCYACSFCKTPLVNRTFMPTERYVYCSKNCYRCHESLRKNSKAKGN